MHDPGSTGQRSSTLINGSSSSQGPVKLRASTAYEEYDVSCGPSGYPYPAGSPGSGGLHGLPASAKRRSRSKERDVVLLESGLIMERVDIQREEKEERERRRAEEKEERRRTRKVSRVSTTGLGFSDASSMHSISAPIQGVNYGGSRSQISLIASEKNPGLMTGAGTKRLSTPTILSPPRPPMARGVSQSSNESRGTPRFFGFRHWSGAFGSEASNHHASGSMMDMQ